VSLGTILLTGGSGGLGRAAVEVLLEQGARVAFTFRADEVGARRLEEASHGGARAYALDLADPAAPDALAARVEAELGPLDGLVNGAGVRADGLLAMTSDEEWRRLLEINLGGVFRCCRAVLPGMMHRRRGAIVNVTSLSARFGLAGQTGYAAAKAGIVGLTRSLAREVGGRGVRVNAVAPGFLSTELTAGLPEDVVVRLRERECLSGGVEPGAVGEAIAFLLSDRARAITGQCVFVDAGASA
jgi:3-oxoacyl-[acyl-carrier protein] reductase